MAIGEVIARLSVVLGLDTAAFTSGVSGVQGDMTKLQRNFEKFGTRISDLGKKLTIGLTTPLLAIGAAAVKGAQEQAAAVAQVEAALTSMGAVSGKTAKELAKAADAMEMRSLFNADVILTKVTANLLTFGRVAGEQFDRAQQAAIDMATRMGSDPQAAAIMLGKALNDPIKGITALTRVGVQFSKAQKDQIKAFAETGEVAKAQGIILSEVERQFKGAAQAAADATPWRQAQVAIDQAMDKIGEAILPVIPVIANAIRSVATAFTNLSPPVQNFIIVAGGLTAALGPLLIAIGALLHALAPLAAMIVGSVIPAIVKFGWGAVAAVTQFGLLHGSIGVLTVSIRALLVTIAPWAAAIAAVAGAAYLLYRRLTEKTAAAHAAEVQSIRTEAALRVEEQATRDLAAAKGEERKANLDAMQASRARGAQALMTAKALQAEARASLITARENIEREVRQFQNSAGAGFKVDPRAVVRQRGEARIQPAVAALREADIKIAKLEGSILGIDKAIAAATAPTKLPALAAGIDDVGKASERAAGSASKAVDPLKQLLDELFPGEAAMREANANLALLKKSLDAGKISAERYSQAVVQLWRDFMGGLNDGWMDVAIESTAEESVEEISKRLSGSFADAMDTLAKKSGIVKTQVVKSFKDMADETIAALDRVGNAIRSGGFLDILSAVIGLGLQLGSIGAFGKRIAANINSPAKIPGNANGTGWWRGGLTMVGERGPELVNLPRGAGVTPNNKLGRLGGIAEIRPSPYFEVAIDGRIQRAAPAIARAGAAGGVATMRKSASRRVA